MRTPRQELNILAKGTVITNTKAAMCGPLGHLLWTYDSPQFHDSVAACCELASFCFADVACWRSADVVILVDDVRSWEQMRHFIWDKPLPLIAPKGPRNLNQVAATVTAANPKPFANNHPRCHPG
jgi:hypothetical protein